MEKSYGRCLVSEIQILPLGALPEAGLAELRAGLVAVFACPGRVLPAEPIPPGAFHAGRQQYCSTQILAGLSGRAATDSRLLAVTSSDLYVPVLTFVFGEAQMQGPAAVVSSWRLRQEFYGLPPDIGLLRDRLLKESVHELGHTFGLTHCEDFQCVMAPSHAVEWIDLKAHTFCAGCRERLLAGRDTVQVG